MKKVFATLCLLAYVAVSYSQEIHFRLQTIELPENFTDRNISMVEKDAAGLLWFVTNGGLHRFDGGEVIKFDLKSQPALLHPSITALFADDRNNLWIGAEGGLSRFDLTSWNIVPIKSPDAAQLGAQDLHIRCIGQGSDGSIYAGTQNGKLFVVRKDSLEMILDIRPDYAGIRRFPAIVSVQEPYPGQLWLTTETTKLIRLRFTKGKYERPEYFGVDEFKQAGILSAYFHPSGMCLFLLENNGLFLLDTRTGAIKRPSVQPGDNIGKSGVAFLTALEGNVFLLTNQPDIGKHQLFTYDFSRDKITAHTIQYPHYLKDNRVVFMETVGHSMIMSLNNNLLELNPVESRFKTWLSDADAINSIRSMYKVPGGKLYVGSYKDGFIGLDETSGEIQQIASNYFVYRMLPWNSDSLLLATEGDGLIWYEPEENKLSPLAIHRALGDRTEVPLFITALARESEDLVWAGTYQGLFLINTRTGATRAVGDERLRQTKIYQVLKKGKRWLIATQYGLMECVPETGGRFSVRESAVKGFIVYCVAIVNGRVWLGTNGHGILVMDEQGQLTDTISSAIELADDVVYSLLIDGDRVLAGTNKGLSVINSRDFRIRNFTTIDHLPSNEFNHSAGFVRGGTAWMGTINGIARFNTDSLVLSKELPADIPVYVTRLTTELKKTGIQHRYSVPYKDTVLVIGSGQRYFSIRFGGIHESLGQIQYHYRLGYHADWHDIGQKHEITFIGMDPGDYQLQLAARLPDGQWINELLEIPLIVQPDFHQTIWFKALLILLIVCCIWFVFWYRERQLRREKQLRMKIAGDLHDEVGGLLTRIYFQADTLSMKPHSGNDKGPLQKIASTSKHALSTMSDMVWSIDSRFDTEKELIVRMKDYLYKLQQELNIPFHMEVRGGNDNLPLSQMIRQNLFLIFKEALSNAVKHGDGSEIGILISFEHSILMEISNGYCPGNARLERRQGGRGIENMRLRAAKMKGKLAILQQEDEFRLQLRVNQ